MSRLASYGSILALGALSMGCTRYAVLYVNSNPETAQLWSGRDGQYLGATPTALRYTKRSGEADPTVVIIFSKDGYQTVFKVIKIDKWSGNWLDANINQNTAHADLDRVSAPAASVTASVARSSW